MRINNLLTAGGLAALVMLAACERKTETQDTAPASIERVEALLSDELPGLSAPATGVAFWEHPTLSFNSLLFVANENGVVSYDMENGTEVSRVDGFDARGAEVSYFGFGAAAAGFLAFFDEADSLFRFYGVDNASRAFLPLDPGPEIRGVVRDFCMGRALDGRTPILFVVQKGRIQFFGLEGAAEGVAVTEQGEINTPDNMMTCATDRNGELILAADDGALYRLNSNDAFQTPIGTANTQSVRDLAIIRTNIPEAEAVSLREIILVLDGEDGALHVLDASEGRALGVVDFNGTEEMPAAGPAAIMNVSSANLGALYRDGVIAMGAEGDEGPVIRIAPASSLLNALSLPLGEPVSPRGATPEADDGLNFSVPALSNQPE